MLLNYMAKHTYVGVYAPVLIKHPYCSLVICFLVSCAFLSLLIIPLIIIAHFLLRSIPCFLAGTCIRTFLLIRGQNNEQILLCCCHKQYSKHGQYTKEYLPSFSFFACPLGHKSLNYCYFDIFLFQQVIVIHYHTLY